MGRYCPRCGKRWSNQTSNWSRGKALSAAAIDWNVTSRMRFAFFKVFWKLRLKEKCRQVGGINVPGCG